MKWNPKQAEFFAAVASGVWFTIAMIGANQWGKSVAMAAQCVAWISGIPVADWHRTPDELTRAHLGRPKTGWAATTTLKASRGGQQGKINDLLPKAWIRRGVYEKDTGYSKGVVVLHNESSIAFKSEEQGLGEFETETVDFVWLDEVQDMSYPLYSKIIARLVAKAGRILASGLPAAAWVVDLFIDKRITLGEEEGSAASSIYTIHGEMRDNLAMSPKSIEMAEANWTEEERRLRSFGRPVVLEGLVYPEFGMHNVVAPFTMRFDWQAWHEGLNPQDQGWLRGHQPWTPYEGIDPGYGNAYAVAFCAMNPDGELFVIDELYERGQCNDAMAERIKAKRRMLGYDQPALAVIDTAGTQRREIGGISTKSQLEKHGIYTTARKFDVNQSTSKVRMWMKPSGFPAIRPRLYVFASCKNWLREVRSHRVKAPDEATRQYLGDKEVTLEADNHLLDATRYLIGHEPLYHDKGLPPWPEDSIMGIRDKMRGGSGIGRRGVRSVSPRPIQRRVIGRDGSRRVV